MKSKTSFVIVYWWLFLLFVGGILLLAFGEKKERMSEAENRMLSGFPEVSAESVFSGEFSTGFESYLSDGVFGRDSLVGVSEDMLRVFTMNTEEETALLNEREMAAELQGTAFGEDEAKDDEVLSDTDAESASDTDISENEDTQDDGEILEDEGEAEIESVDSVPVSKDIKGNGLFFKLKGGGYRRTHYASPSKLKKVANMLNEYKKCLPEDGHVFYTNVPLTDTGIMLRNKNKYSGWYENYDVEVHKHTIEGVHFVNTPALLEKDLRARKDLYFRSDHHWTPLAAIKVVNECMRIQGVPTVPYSEYKYRTNKFENKKRGTVDDMELLYPLQEVKGYRMNKGKQGKSTPLIKYTYNTYIAYLSGDSKVFTKYVTGFSTGRNALVIGDSFSNAFTPYLMPYYDEVYKVDARYYVPKDNGGTIQELIGKYGIDDVYIIVSYANGVRSPTSLEKLEKALYGK